MNVLASHRLTFTVSSNFWQLINDLLGFSGPVLLKVVVTFVQDFAKGNTTVEHGYFLFVVILACYVSAALLSTQYNLRMSRLQLHVRTALVSAIYAQVRAFLSFSSIPMP